jgi:hypothetical protein
VTRYDRDDASDGQGGRHPLAGVPQEVLDAAVTMLTLGLEPAGSEEGPEMLVVDADDVEPVAHSVLLLALDTWLKLVDRAPLEDWARQARAMPSQDGNRSGLPGPDETGVEAAEAERCTCTGAADCRAGLHVHGCWADEDGFSCDEPGEHGR